MENSSYQHTHDCIYEDMSSTSPLTDEGYITSSGSVTSSNHPRSVSSGSRPSTSRFRFSSRGSRPAAAAPLSVYMNMENKTRGDQEATLVPDPARGLMSRDTVSRDQDTTLRAPCYEYIDIQFPGERVDQPPSPIAPPCLPSRNKRPSQPAPLDPQSRDKHVIDTQSRDKLSEGIKSYQEQSRLQHEMMVNFSASLLGPSSQQPRTAVGSNAQSRGFSAV